MATESFPRLTVYEAINRARKEVYIGATPHPMHVLIRAFHASRPPMMAGWRADDVEFHSIAFQLEPEDAANCIRRRSGAHAGWTVLTASPAAEP